MVEKSSVIEESHLEARRISFTSQYWNSLLYKSANCNTNQHAKQRPQWDAINAAKQQHFGVCKYTHSQKLHGRLTLPQTIQQWYCPARQKLPVLPYLRQKTLENARIKNSSPL